MYLGHEIGVSTVVVELFELSHKGCIEFEDVGVLQA